MQMLRETERVMRDGCPICVQATPIVGPVGCCGCPSDEQFPGIWYFANDFSIGGDYSRPEVVAITGSGASCLGNVNPAGSGYATATQTAFRTPVSEIKGYPLVRAVGPGGVPGCLWGYAKGRYDGWIYYPTYGSPSPPVDGCPLTEGFTEKRCSFSYTGPQFNSYGVSVVSNPFGGCIVPSTNYAWSGVPESGLNGTPLANALFFDTAPCSSYPTNFLTGSLKVFQICWNWDLRCITSPGLSQILKLSLHSSHYSYTSFDRIIHNSGVWAHDEFGSGSTCAGSLFVSSGSAASISTAWVAEYPCGNPDSITLTNPNPIPVGESNPMLGMTFPETITLRASR